MTPPTIPNSMIVANPQSNAQSKLTTEKSPEGSPSDRTLKIKAAIEHATQCIVTHMRNQILSGKNGL
jgi:hypothetical protein